MRILIIYFSGTGNTARMAEVMQREFLAKREHCVLMPMEEFTLGKASLDLGQWDLIGLGYPVHALDAPQIFYDFLDSLPQARQPYFLFKTAGSSILNGGSTLRIREKLSNLGWRLRHEQLYVMPPNAFGTARPSKVEKRYYRCRSLAQRSARAIVAGIKNRVPEAPFQKSCYAFARLEKHGASQSSKRWIVNSNCTLCGLCESQCPSANISIQDGKHVFGEKCLLCLRCWWNCPVRAIDHKFLHPFLLKEPYTLPED